MSVPKVRKSGSPVPSRRSMLPGALKHGAFSSIELLPFEDGAEAEQLWQELLQEHEPDGPSQVDCVRGIFMATWRKRRLYNRRIVETRVTLQRPENRVFDRHPNPLFNTRFEQTIHNLKKPSSETINLARDDYERLFHFSSSLHLATDAKIVDLTIGLLPEEYKTHLRANVRQEDFEETPHWIVAIKKEIDGVLLPRVRERRPDADGYLSATAELLAPDKMLEDLEIEARLDAQIDRYLRRLFWLKTQKKLDREAKQKLVNAKVS